MLVLFGLVSIVNADLTTNNKAYWTLDNTLVDATGNGNTLTNTNSAFVTGKINDSIDLNGVSSKISRSSNPLAGVGTGDFTISMWVNSDTHTSTGTVLQFGEDESGDEDTIKIHVVSSGMYRLFVNEDAGGSVIIPTSPISDGTYYFLVIERLSGNLSFYMDDIFQGSVISNHNLNSVGFSNYIGFGSNHFAPAVGSPDGTFFNGKEDEISVWDRGLSSLERTTIYNSDIGLQYPYIVAEPTLTFTNITANNITLINNTFYNDSIQFETTVLNTSTNGNVNHSYSLNGASFVQYATNTLNGSVNLNLSEGLYNISFQGINNETSVNSTNYSIIVDLTAPVIDVIGNLSQNVYAVNFSTIFNVTDALSGLASCTINITYLTSSEPDSNFFINCTDTQIFTRAGLYQGTLVAIDNAGNVNSLTVNGSINPVSNIFFEDELNVSISNYDYILISPIGRTSQEINTNNPVQISPLFNNTTDFGIYNITFSKVGYITQTVQVEINSTNAGQNVTFNINDAEIIVTILDRETGTIVSGPFFQLEFIAAVGLVTNTTTGTATITNTFFESGSYQLVSSGINYTTEQLFFEFTNQESLPLTIYTTDETDLARGVVEIKVVDKFGKSVVGAIGQALQWDSATSSYIKVAEGLTAEDGKTLLNIILDTKQYIFQAKFGELAKNTSPQFIPELLNGKIITISLDLGPTVFEGFLENVNYNIDENLSGTISNITLDWETTDGTSVEGCIIYFRVQPSGAKTEISNDCSTGSNNILIVSKQLNSTYYIEAQVGFVIGGGFYPQETFLYQPVFDISTILKETNLALFILPLLYLVVVLVGMANVFIGALLLLLVNGVGLWLVPQFITPSVVAFFYFVGLALMIGGSKRK